eukprot:TRINITY_DN3126_c0_g1_i1.p1 TRINITY_DN3126_c0_g1~~TRINITY_DN3126_c0_g1_i1.p1  ORF type:complete len:752 (-),score=192.50 TRINITY_DN3126_c0_g1_i1:1914-4169(-)
MSTEGGGSTESESGEGCLHVHTLLVAEFDIDKGCVIRAQYPVSLPISEQVLADRCLPDGAHNRDEDWTVFYLTGRDVDDQMETQSSEEIGETPCMGRSYVFNAGRGDWERRSSQSVEESVHLETKPNAKGDGLDAFLRIDSESGEEILSMKLSENSEFSVVDEDEEKRPFGTLIGGSEVVGLKFFTDSDASRFLRELTAVKSHTFPGFAKRIQDGRDSFTTKLCMSYMTTRKDSSMRRGALVRSICMVSESPYFFMFRPLLRSAIDFIHGLDSVVPVLKQLYTAMNGTDMTHVPRPTKMEKRTWRWALDGKHALHSKDPALEGIRDGHMAGGSSPALFYPITAIWDDRPVKLFFPLCLESGEFGDPRASVKNLFDTFGHSIITIFYSILVERRVLFLSRRRSAAEVCFSVLACAHLFPSVLMKKLHERLFPYVSLLSLSFVDVEGYIAGVTNPMFADRKEWWDVLCDLDDGSVTVSESILQNANEEAMAVWGAEGTKRRDVCQPQPLDEVFIEELSQKVDTMVLHGVSKANACENLVRWKFRLHMWEFVDLCLGERVHPSDAMMERLYIEHAKRMALFRKTKFFALLKAKRDGELADKGRQSIAQIRNATRHIRSSERLDELSLLNLLQTLLKTSQKKEELMELLCLFPQCDNGLDGFANVLFHPSPAVRLVMVAILRRLESSFQEGKEAMSSLNIFTMLAFERASQELPDTEQPSPLPIPISHDEPLLSVDSFNSASLESDSSGGSEPIQ